MSKITGQPDLYDLIFPEGSENCCKKQIKKFIKETGGEIFQYKQCKLTKYNLYTEMKACPMLVELTGSKSYKYMYMGKKYRSLSSIPYIKKTKISVNSYFDLFPYYAHTILCDSIDNTGKRFIIISGKSIIQSIIDNAEAFGFPVETTNAYTYMTNLTNEFIVEILEIMEGDK